MAPASGSLKRGTSAVGEALSAEHILQTCPLFHGLDAAGRHDLAKHARRQPVAAGAAIFDVGAPGTSMMAVLHGGVRISLPSARGKEIILADLGAGDVFGEIALLDGQPRSASARARVASTLLVLERRDVHALLRKRPEFCLSLIEVLCARLRRSDERMADLAFFDLPARLARTLLKRKTEAVSAGRESPLSQSDIAKMIGASREPVNRCLRDWERRGLVSLDGGRIAMIDIDAISALAGAVA